MDRMLGTVRYGAIVKRSKAKGLAAKFWRFFQRLNDSLKTGPMAESRDVDGLSALSPYEI